MRIVTIRAFRTVCVCTLIAFAAAYCLKPIDTALMEAAGVDVGSLRQSIGFPLFEIVVGWVNFILAVCGIAGAIWFQPWARVLMAIAVTLWLPLTFARGILVVGPLEAVASATAATLFVWLFTVMYWSNISQSFSRSKNESAS